jgi:peptidoglycan/xylan/chitin deacetylase (PgdA/CDA1 family)
MVTNFLVKRRTFFSDVMHRGTEFASLAKLIISRASRPPKRKRRWIKPLLSKLNFALNRNPKIEKSADWRRFIPEPYQSVLLISADFELAWAWQFAKVFKDPVAEGKKLALRERDNIPKILGLCDIYNIPITWATVGHLFLESCNRISGIAHPEISRLPNLENDFWKYSGKDWFENDPCSDYIAAPEWYCPDLIKMIMDANVKHEIGCHTFSHIDCRDEICSKEQLKTELQACMKIAEDWNIILKSFVHPGYTIGNLDTLAEEGFTNFRTDYRNVLGYPKKHDNGLWELKQTAEFIFRKNWSIDYHIYRYKEIIKRAIESNTICVLWFHPSFDKSIIDKIWPEVFQFIDKARNKIWVTTHTEFIEWIETRQ